MKNTANKQKKILKHKSLNTGAFISLDYWIRIFVCNLHGKSMLPVIVPASEKGVQPMKSPASEPAECHCVRIQYCGAASNRKCQHHVAMAIANV